MNKVIYALLGFYFFTSQVMADTITMATVDWQPFQGQNINQQGFTAEITRQALERNGHILSLNFIPWARAVEDVQKGRYHALFNQWKNKDNQNDYYFSNEVFAAGDGHFLTLAQDNFSVKKLDDLAGKTIGIVRAYPVSDELTALIDQGIVKKYEVSSVVQLIKLLRLGRIDIILENELVAKYNFRSYFPTQHYDFKTVGKDLIDGRLFIGWSKSVAGTQVLRDQFDMTIRAMRKDGTIDKIKREFKML